MIIRLSKTAFFDLTGRGWKIAPLEQDEGKCQFLVCSHTGVDQISFWVTLDVEAHVAADLIAATLSENPACNYLDLYSLICISDGSPQVTTLYSKGDRVLCQPVLTKPAVFGIVSSGLIDNTTIGPCYVITLEGSDEIVYCKAERIIRREPVGTDKLL